MPPFTSQKEYHVSEAENDQQDAGNGVDDFLGKERVRHLDSAEAQERSRGCVAERT